MQSTLAIREKQKQDAGQQLSPAGRNEGAAPEVRTRMQGSHCEQWGQGTRPDPQSPSHKNPGAAVQWMQSEAVGAMTEGLGPCRQALLSGQRAT